MRSREGIGWWITLLLLIPINAGHRLSWKDIRKHYYGDQDADISEEYRALQNDIRQQLAGLDPQLLKHFYVDSEECDEVNCLEHSVEEEDDESEEVTERLTMRPKDKKSTSKTKREEVTEPEVTTTNTVRPSTTTATTQEPSSTTTFKTTTTSTTQIPTTRTTTTPTTSTTLPSTTQPTTTTTTSTTTTTTTTPKPTTTTTIKTTIKPSTTRLPTTTTTKPPTTTTTTKRPTTTTSTTTVPTTTEYIPPNTTVHFTTTIEPFQFFVQRSSEEQPVRPATPIPKFIPIISPTVLSLPKSASKSNDVLARIYQKLHKLKLLKHHRQKAEAGPSRKKPRSKTSTLDLNKLDENQFATVGEIVVKFPGHQPQKGGGGSRKPRHQPNPARNRLRRQGSGAKRMKEEKKKARKMKKLLKEAQRKFKKESKKENKKKKRGVGLG